MPSARDHEALHSLIQRLLVYWTKATLGLRIYAKNGRVGAPASGRYLYFDDEGLLRRSECGPNAVCSIFAVIAFSDCLHLSDTLVSNFPVPGALPR